MQRDSNGYVIDNLKSCGPFDDDGNNNGLTSVIEDHLGSFSRLCSQQCWAKPRRLSRLIPCQIR